MAILSTKATPLNGIQALEASFNAAPPFGDRPVKISLLLSASALAFAGIPAPATAQMDMPGMSMPPSKHAAKKKPAAKKKVAPKATAKTSTAEKKAEAKTPPKKMAGSMKGMAMPKDHGGMPMPAHSAPSGPMPMDQSQHGTMQMPNQPSGTAGQAMPMGHSQMDHAPGQMNMPMGQSHMGAMQMQHGGHQMAMTAALGSYPQQRESSGTAWQPDNSASMTGPMSMTGDWMLMAHGTVNLVYDHQSGPRGDDKAFASGMLMGMAEHALANGTLQFRAMLSPTH
jgi:hypothetical protein